MSCSSSTITLSIITIGILTIGIFPTCIGDRKSFLWGNRVVSGGGGSL